LTEPRGNGVRATFTDGSIFRHVLVMTLTSSVGVMAVFFIDLLSMFWVSTAHRDDWRAAVSLMSKVMFFPFSLSMGMMIGIGTVVSVAVGRGDRSQARRLASTGLLLTAALGLAVSLAALPWRVAILKFFGAEGAALDQAARLLAMVLPVNVLLAIGMGCASILRADGDPKRAMYVTLAGAVVTAAADPLFIFGLGRGVDGVGMAVIASRVAFVAVGLWGTVHEHGMVTLPRWPLSRAALRAIAVIAIPAMAANLALPFADWYVTRTIWQFGVSISAAAGVYDRIMPLAFSVVFALTTAIGPIVGQNLGARAHDRVRETFRCSITVVGFYGLTVWLVLAAAAPGLADAFGLSGPTGTFFRFLCRYATIAWICVAFLLVANSMFNTLGRAHVSTLFNWGRATLGTIPFVWFGAHSGGPEVAMIGIAAASSVFGFAALGLASFYTRRLGRGAPAGDAMASRRDLHLTPP
jgi:Na+-driven multidrug efflux pump